MILYNLAFSTAGLDIVIFENALQQCLKSSKINIKYYKEID